MSLFGALSQARVLYSNDVNLIYRLLVQIYNNLFVHMDAETKEKHNKLEEQTRDEMTNFNKKSKSTYFTFKSNEWERELRAFFKQVQKDSEFTPGGI